METIAYITSENAQKLYEEKIELNLSEESDEYFPAADLADEINNGRYSNVKEGEVAWYPIPSTHTKSGQDILIDIAPYLIFEPVDYTNSIFG